MNPRLFFCAALEPGCGRAHPSTKRRQAKFGSPGRIVATVGRSGQQWCDAVRNVIDVRLADAGYIDSAVWRRVHVTTLAQCLQLRGVDAEQREHAFLVTQPADIE